MKTVEANAQKTAVCYRVDVDGKLARHFPTEAAAEARADYIRGKFPEKTVSVKRFELPEDLSTSAEREPEPFRFALVDLRGEWIEETFDTLPEALKRQWEFENDPYAPYITGIVQMVLTPEQCEELQPIRQPDDSK